MRSFTKVILMLLLCTLGVLTTQAKTEKVHATFENPSNTNTTWNAETKTFTWSTTYYNQLKNIGLPNGDLTKFKKLVVDCSIKSGDQFRILFYKGGSNLTLYAKDGVNEFILADTLKVISPNDYNEYLLACDEICLSGNNAAAPGEAVINDVYLETYDDEGEKVYATFENPSNTNTTWNAETKTFTWSTTYYNQLKNIGLPSGDISVYKKLVVDCNIKSGDQFRILIYKGGSNLTLYAKDGVNEFILADTLKTLYPNDYNEYLLACDEICLSGNNAAAPGEAVINAVYLETYPENESVEIPDIVYEEDPGKPEGEFVDFTEVFSTLQPRIGLGTDGHPIVLGNGDVVVGQRTKDVIADLSAYSKLTIVTSPKMKLVLYMNHEVEAQQNAGDYAEGDAGKYVFMDVQADENGIIEVDLTQFDKQDLNCICLPWDNNNKGTVWYLLLTAKPAVAEDVLPIDIQFGADFNEKSISNYTSTWTATKDGKTWSLVNFNNNQNKWNSVKCGRKNNESVASITSPAIDAVVKNYVISLAGAANVNSAKLAIMNGEQKVGDDIDITEKFVAGEVNVPVEGQKGYSYVLTIDNASASANGSVEITKVTLYGEGQYVEVEPVHIANTAETAYDVAKAIELIEAGEALTDSVFVKGIISKIDSINAEIGFITYWISADGTEESQQFECYKGLSMEGLALDAIEVGAEVIVKGTLKKYGDIYELNSGNLLVSYKAPEKPVDPASITSIAKKAEMTGEVTSLEALQGAKFMLQNEAGLVLYTPDGWDVKVADLVTAASNKGNGGFFTLNALDGDHAGQYQVLIWNLDGTRRTYWAGEQYLNSQPEGGNVIFGLGGTEPNYGQDGQNLALWTITYEEGKGFAFHCVGRDVYLGNDAEAARPVADITYWKAYTGYIAGYDEDEILAAYADVATVVKTTEDAAALADAKTAYDSDKNLDKFGDAVNAAVDIVKACVALNEAYGNLDATGAVVAAEVLAKYNAGEYANVAALRAAYILAAKAQTTAGANMTLAIVNPSFEDGTINGWVSDNCGGVANNYNFGARTGDKFCERWTAAPGKLSDGSFLQTITGIPNGKYILTAELQNREQGNSDAAGHGFFLVANDGKTEGVTNDGATIETVGVVTDGTLEIGVKLEGCTGNWICFDNFQLTYAGAVASEDELAALTAEIAIAKSLGVDVSAYEEGVFTAAEAAAAVEALKVAEYTQVNKDYTVNAAVLVPDFAQWTGDMVSNKGQHWDGTGTSLYYEQTSAQWGQSSWTNNKKTTVTLPKGKYVLYAAGRASAGTACTAYIKVNDVTRYYTSKGDVGFGVATDGSASFDPTASYANGGKGRGFEYRYVAFEVASEEGEEIALEIGGEATAEHQWMSFTAPVLLTTEDNIAIMLPVLNGKITAAKADLDAIKGTVGNGLFMKPQAAYDDYAAAVSAAEPLVEAGATPTAEAIKAAIDAIDAKAEAFAAAPVNAPDANKTYSFELRLGGETPLYMALAEGGITIAEEATLLKFIAVEGAEGQYNLSNADGTLFVGLAGGNAWTMSTLPDQKAAWTFTALPDGAYRINNLVTAGRFVGTNSGDKEAGKPCYADKQTSNGNVDWIITEVIPEVAHTWNFTKWSEATVANLKAEAAKGASEGLWSDWEKADGTAATMEISKDNCFWQVGTSAAEGETLTANGEEIAELKGLLFKNNKARSLAIAVNYGDCTSANGEGFGPYNGASYLWLGSKNIEYFTIKNVKAGSQIKMGVESHKLSAARGVQLLIGETVLKDAEGAEVAAPKEYTEQTWAVPAGEGVVDVVVKNTDGCHIYFIDAEIGEAPEPVDPALIAAQDALKAIIAADKTIATEGQQGADDLAAAIATAETAAETAATVEDVAAARAALASAVATFTKANLGDAFAEIEQTQSPEISDGASRAAVVEGNGYNQYTTDGGVCVITKKYDIDVTGCDYVTVKFAEPVPAGICIAFWAQSGTDNVGITAGAFEHKYVFADDAKCAVVDDVLPQITLLTLWNPQTVNIVGIYKHYTEDYLTRINAVNAQRENGMIFNLNGQKMNKAQKGLNIINGKKVMVK